MRMEPSAGVGEVVGVGITGVGLAMDVAVGAPSGVAVAVGKGVLVGALLVGSSVSDAQPK